VLIAAISAESASDTVMAPQNRSRRGRDLGVAGLDDAGEAPALLPNLAVPIATNCGRPSRQGGSIGSSLEPHSVQIGF
jgi:hypothetical protein